MSEEAKQPIAEFSAAHREDRGTVKVLQRPAKWRRRSTAPFYKERFALEVKAELDKMAADTTKADKMYIYADWAKWYTPNTLYVYLNQSIKFLCEYMDPDDTYKKLMDTIGIQREKNRGIRLFFDRDIKEGIDGGAIGAKTVQRGKPRYQTSIEDFLEDDSEMHLHIPNLCLTDDEIARIKSTFVGITGVECNITTTDIKILKISL